MAGNVDVVRGIYESFGRGDFPSAMAALDPEIERIESDEEFLPHRGTHRSPSEVAQNVFGAMQLIFDEFAIAPKAFHDAGDVDSSPFWSSLATTAGPRPPGVGPPSCSTCPTWRHIRPPGLT